MVVLLRPVVGDRTNAFPIGFRYPGVPNRRGISPVVGVVLMIVVTLLLASVVAVGVTSIGDDLDADSAVPTAVPDGSIETVATDRWVGSPGDLFSLSNDQAGATNGSMRVNFTIEDDSNTIGNSLNSVRLESNDTSLTMFAGTERSDLERIAVDEDGDGIVDREITGDVNGWTVSDGGSTLKIELSGSAYSPEAGDSIVVVFGGVTNPPDAGTYALGAQTSGDGNWQYGTVTITT